MTTHDALPAAVLQRKAVVYVRQSTPQQVQSNLESQRRQYELVEVARRRGFTNIDVIDDTLVAPRVAALNGLASIAWSPPCAPGRLVRCCVSKPRGSRSAPRSSMVVRARAMATASRWAHGRYSSRIITRATSAGQSTSVIRRCRVGDTNAYTTRAGRTIACCSV